MTLKTLLAYGLAAGVFTTLLLFTIHQSNLPHVASSRVVNERQVIQANLPTKNTLRHEEQPRTTSNKDQEVVSSSCVPQKKFVFIKTHKTGTTTTINIFQRYAIYNKLKVLMPVGQGPLSWPFPPKENEYVHTPDEKYDALMHHFVYNKTWLRTKFPPETKYISIIREPFSHLKCQISYYHLAKILRVNGHGNAVKVFLQNPWRYRNRSETFFPHVNITWDGTRNPMTFDMGWPAERADEEEEARKYINQLDTEFTLVMILEYLDESVVLLRRLMCWELRDVLLYSKSKNTRPYSYKTYVATPEELENHRRWSAIDYMLYNTFNNSLWRKINAQGPDFYDEVTYYRRTKNEVSEFCTRTKERDSIGKQPMVVAPSKWNAEFKVDKTYCSYITKTRTMSLDRLMKGRKYTKKEMSYAVIDQIINYRLLSRGLPTFNSRHDAHAAGIQKLRTRLFVDKRPK
ncbi:galactose-3-O-sulfotransferase 2-like [Branchiostoma floridae]|uniref:Galactose-3-O-sulfotransferase 2-like n=1 Tax=Branchiostoma floridae TaxID=7739 RepID=A0A9J7HPJ8_BRAFL|nr:galactose-3-O-sulfotransferase 2-like [Branchiostoma floridae]